jgi:hypothetical protein
LFQHENSEQHSERDGGNGDNVTERFEVTITKMNTEDEDEGRIKDFVVVHSWRLVVIPCVLHV